jgi:hypothetical protein
MRPDVDIDESLDGVLSELAEKRYDGDRSKAYNQVIKKGLKYTGIPRQKPIEEGDIDNVPFINLTSEGFQERLPPGPPIVFHQYLSLSESLYHTRAVCSSSMKIKEFKESLKTLSQYRGVEVDEAAFGIRRRGGIWVGWGFADCIASLSKYLERHKQADLEEYRREEFGLVFAVGSVYVMISARHQDSTSELRQINLQLVERDPTQNTDDAVSTVLGVFDADTRSTAKIVDSRHHYEHKIIPIESEEVTRSAAPNGRMTEKIQIKTHENTDHLSRIDKPEELVLHLISQVAKEEWNKKSYQVEEFGVTDHKLINISLRGNWR